MSFRSILLLLSSSLKLLLTVLTDLGTDGTLGTVGTEVLTYKLGLRTLFT